MNQKNSFYKRISLALGITTLLLGLIPVPVLGRVGMVSADDSLVGRPATLRISAFGGNPSRGRGGSY